MSKYSIYWIYYLVLQLYPWNIYPFIYIYIYTNMCVCEFPRLSWSPLKMIDVKTPASIPSWGCANALQPICLMADKACRWERFPVDVPIFSGMCSCVCVRACVCDMCVYPILMYIAYSIYMCILCIYIYVCVSLINTHVWSEREREGERERERREKERYRYRYRYWYWYWYTYIYLHHTYIILHYIYIYAFIHSFMHACIHSFHSFIHFIYLCI